MSRTIRFSIEHGDITSFDVDVVVLKYAQEFYGVDAKVASAIYQTKTFTEDLRPQIGKHCYITTLGRIRAHHALFIGVPPLYSFGYQEIRKFSAIALRTLAHKAPETKHLAMTIHGVGYGLDEVEAFFAQIAGCLDAMKAGELPPALSCISIIEINYERVQRLQQAFERSFIHFNYASKTAKLGTFDLTIPEKEEATEATPKDKPTIESAGEESEAKPHAFIVMPFSKDMDDVFYYGIQKPVHDIGFLCERIDQDSFTGDVLDQIKRRIENAAVVIAELSNSNPNVYLELGYAWGKGRPTILLVRDTKELLFDVQGQRCLVYGRIKDLESALIKELEELKSKECI